MSEAVPEGGTPSAETPGADEFKAITSQEDLNRIISERVKRVEAKFGDYKDAKAKAAKLDEIENANRTEAEKAQARIAELESELTGVRSESTRLRIASEHGITDPEDIALFLTGTDDETLTKQAERLAGRAEDRKKQGPHVPREGATSSPLGDNDERRLARDLFAGGA